MDENQIISLPTPIKAIRLHCLECMGGSSQEVEKCTRPSCPLWHYRFGKHPTFKMSPEEKARRSEQGRKIIEFNRKKPLKE